MKSQLNLIILPETDCRFLSIVDRSIYNENLPIEKPTFIIKTPNCETVSYFTYVPNKINTINSYILGLSDTNIVCLNDGIYHIKQQICPHDKLYEEYYHLRTVALDCRLDKIRCSISNNCAQKDTIKKVEEVEFWIKQAKAAVESCGLLDKGEAMYKEAKLIISKIETNCDC